MTEIDLEDFKTFLIDELRFSPGIVQQTIRKMEYVLERVPSDSLPGFQAFIRSIWEKAKLLYAADRAAPREAAMGYLLFGTGVRLSEAVNLKIPDIFPDRLFLSKSWLPPPEEKVTTQRLPPREVVRWLP